MFEGRTKHYVSVDSKLEHYKGEAQVSLQRFGQFCSWFGPLVPGDSDIPVGQRVQDLLSQAWFHGNVDIDTVNSRMYNLPPGTFLVRFSQNVRGAYAVSYVTKGGGIAHERISYNPQTGFLLSVHPAGTNKVVKLALKKTHLPLFIEKISDILKLQTACPGSGYRVLFAPAVSGYGQLQWELEGIKKLETRAEASKQTGKPDKG